VISGFVLSYALHRDEHRIVDYFRFLAKRLVRLEPPQGVGRFGIGLQSLTSHIDLSFKHVRTLPFQFRSRVMRTVSDAASLNVISVGAIDRNGKSGQLHRGRNAEPSSRRGCSERF